ncbi:Arginine--tRNA ligase [Apiospora phragmitis]|uniref:arginine--tRNA ligase n=1 Tax=Apiospora phragmitis TaxID=2905665 RepID=A0ABR1TQI5_9PEZI
MASDASVDNLAKEFKDLPALDKYPNCFPDINPVDIYRSHITSILSKITGVDSKIVYPALQWTSTLDKGDIVLPIPALRVKGKPDALGSEWLSKWPGSSLVETPVLNGAFLSFFFKAGPLTQTTIPLALKHRKDFGTNKALPNIAKPFHAGHLRSTIIGGFLANLYEAAGWDVVRINYLGDWGKQYGLLALGFEKYGNEEELTKDPINHLFQVYVKINVDIKAEQDKAEELEKEGKAEEAQKIRDEGLDEQARRYFKLMTESDEKALALWKRFRDLSITRYKQTYARLNIHFDDYSGESQVPESDMEEAANKMREMGLTEEDKGAQLIDFSKHVPGKQGKSLGKVILRKKDGTALYLTRDISELLNREKKYKFDHMIYDIAAKVQHINFGMVLGMSTRKGTVKFLDDILRDVGDFMHDVMRKNEDKYNQVENPVQVADTLGISSVMVQDMTGKRNNNYTFNMETMTSFEGDTGPYLQYAHARLCSITRKAGLSEEQIATADLSLLTEKHAVNLVRVLAQWPDVVSNTLKTLEPTTIMTYLFKMTHTLSSSYDVLRVVGSEHEVMRARMALYDAARVVLNNGMRLLGLSPVER